MMWVRMHQRKGLLMMMVPLEGDWVSIEISDTESKTKPSLGLRDLLLFLPRLHSHQHTPSQINQFGFHLLFRQQLPLYLRHHRPQTRNIHFIPLMQPILYIHEHTLYLLNGLLKLLQPHLQLLATSIIQLWQSLARKRQQLQGLRHIPLRHHQKIGDILQLIPPLNIGCSIHRGQPLIHPDAIRHHILLNIPHRLLYPPLKTLPFLPHIPQHPLNRPLCLLPHAHQGLEDVVGDTHHLLLDIEFYDSGEEGVDLPHHVVGAACLIPLDDGVAHHYLHLVFEEKDELGVLEQLFNKVGVHNLPFGIIYQ